MSQSIDEFSLISTYFKELTSQQDVAVGIGDDADNKYQQRSPDRSSHRYISCFCAFPRHSISQQIATRALCVNLSDMAAMGAVPKWFTLA